MRLHLIRHGDPDYERDVLTERGRREATALAARMRKANLDKLFTSPLGRARETASFIARETSMSPTVLPWTTELELEPIVDAEGNQLSPWGISGEVIRGTDRALSSGGWSGWSKQQRSEYERCQREIVDASDVFLDALGYRRVNGVYEVHTQNEESVAIVCHMGFGLTWLAHLLQLPLSLMWCGMHWAPTSVTTILMEVRAGQIAVPRALSVGDTSHLYAARLHETNQGLHGTTK